MIERITLKGGALVDVDFSQRGTCKKCGEPIIWAQTARNQKWIPIKEDDDGQYISHFSDCQFADEFRKKREEDSL